MKRNWRKVLLPAVCAMMMFSCTARAEAVTEGTPEANAETEVESGRLQSDVLVLFTSDVHCGIDQNFGYAGLQAVRDTAESAGNHVLLVDDGDSIQGEPVGILTKGGGGH